MKRALFLVCLTAPLLADAEDECTSNTAAGLVADLGALSPPAKVTRPATPDSLAAAFSGGEDVSLYSVVRKNSTGAAIKKNGALQYQKMKGVTSIRKHPSGALLIQSALQVDADGSADSLTVDPEHGQVQTSLRYPGRKGQDKYVNTHDIPFFVLPLGWYQQHGVKLGDVGALLYKGKLAYAIFADVGPDEKLGEGSLALHEALGNNPWVKLKSGVVKPWGGIESGVTLVVFPGSGDGTPQTPAAANRVGAEKLGALLGGTPQAVSVPPAAPKLPTLRKGAEGSDVEQLQSALQQAGYYQDKKVDGDFGSGTRRAVEAFQRDHDLKDDGVVGKGTWAALLEG